MSDVRKQAKTLPAIMQVGKQGLTQGTVLLLDRELEQKGLVKVKFLRAFTGGDREKRDEAAARLASLTTSQLILSVGNTATYYRRT